MFKYAHDSFDHIFKWNFWINHLHKLLHILKHWNNNLWHSAAAYAIFKWNRAVEIEKKIASCFCWFFFFLLPKKNLDSIFERALTAGLQIEIDWLMNRSRNKRSPKSWCCIYIWIQIAITINSTNFNAKKRIYVQIYQHKHKHKQKPIDLWAVRIYRYLQKEHRIYQMIEYYLFTCYPKHKNKLLRTMWTITIHTQHWVDE